MPGLDDFALVLDGYRFVRLAGEVRKIKEDMQKSTRPWSAAWHGLRLYGRRRSHVAGHVCVRLAWQGSEAEFRRRIQAELVQWLSQQYTPLR